MVKSATNQRKNMSSICWPGKCDLTLSEYELWISMNVADMFCLVLFVSLPVLPKDISFYHCPRFSPIAQFSDRDPDRDLPWAINLMWVSTLSSSMGLFSYHIYTQTATLFIKIHPTQNLIWHEHDGGEEVDRFALNFLLLFIRYLLNTYRRTDTLVGVADSEVNPMSFMPTRNSQCKGGGKQKANHNSMWWWLWGNATRTHTKKAANPILEGLRKLLQRNGLWGITWY